MRTRTIAAVLAVLALAGMVGGCSNDQAADGPTPGGTLAPNTTGDVCDDARGDIGNDPKGAGSMTEPAGIDIVRAESVVANGTLRVSFTTAGPISLAPDPTFIMAQGIPGNELSFELRAAPTSLGGPWALSLITFRGREQAPIQLPNVPVTVSNDTLTYEVSLKDLPPIATLLWQFGTTSGDPDDPAVSVVFDDCNTFAPEGPTTTAPGSTQVPSTTTTTTPPPAPLGTAVTTGEGIKVTVFEVRAPFTPTRPLAVPLDDGNVLAMVDLEVCAGTSSTQASGTDLKVKTADNRQWAVWRLPQAIIDPAFPDAQMLPGGECVRGWVPVQYAAASAPTQVLYDTSGRGRGPFLIWKLA